jgi:hypothetical protein
LINIKPSTNRYIIMGNARTFPSLSVLVSYHYNHVVSSAGELLTRPCPKQPKIITSSLSSPEILPASTFFPPRAKTLDPTGLRRRAAGNSKDPRQLPRDATSLDKPIEQVAIDNSALAASNPVLAAKVQELTRLLDLEEKIVDATERTMDLPNIDKKSKKKRQKSLARLFN